jgi:hypothetical protein
MKAKLLSLPIFLVSLAALAGCVWLLSESIEILRCASWPRTEGVVDAVRISELVGTRGGVQHKIEISYHFVVDGQTYQGDRFNTRGNFLASEAGAREAGRNYRRGENCSIAYQPSDPAKCFVDTSLTWHTWVKFGLGIGLGIAALVFFVVGLVDVFRTKIAVPVRPVQEPRT